MARNKVIGIGIVGAGFARTTQIPGFKDCIGARVVAIASAHRERAESVADEFKIRNVCNDWRELVARADVDLVSIVTPPATHMEMTLAALEHGKSVLCEKPMAMNSQEARRMAEGAREAGVLALIDHELRFLNGRKMMRAMLHNGAIGKVRHCNYVFRADYRAVLDRPWDWWSDEAMGGGTLGAIGSHAIDSFRWMVGAEIAQVSCMLSTHIAERPEKATGAIRRVTTDERPGQFRAPSALRDHDRRPAFGSGLREQRKSTGSLWGNRCSDGRRDRRIVAFAGRLGCLAARCRRSGSDGLRDARGQLVARLHSIFRSHY